MALLTLNIGGRETLDHHHGTTAARAAPGRSSPAGDGPGGRCFRLMVEQFLAKGQQTGPMAAGQKAEEADADEAAGQRVQQKPAQELFGR